MDNQNTIKSKCQELINIKNIKDYSNNFVASFCTFSEYGNIVSKELKNTNIKTAVVAGYFPLGQAHLELKIKEVEYACNNADEIDYVFSIGKFLNNEYDFIDNELNVIRNICKDRTLKIIIETGELKTEDNIIKACKLCIKNNVDFIKTSTGKTPISATIEAVQTIALEIKKHYLKTNKPIGIKVSGGITNISQAIEFVKIVENTLGEKWISPQLFRIGTSRLNQILNII